MENVLTSKKASFLLDQDIGTFKSPNENQGLISIITRTKDRQLFLKRALTSVLCQTYSQWELIVVNDGGSSIDDCVQQILNDCPKNRIKVINNVNSVGMEAASNVGLSHAQGEFVCLLDDDDTWEPTFLQKTITHLNLPTSGDLAGVCTHSMIVFETLQNGVISKLGERHHNPWMRAISFSELLSINTFFVNSFVYRKQIIEEIGGYNEILPVVGDWEFNIRVLLKWNIGVLPEPLANYHQRLNDSDLNTGNTVIRDQGLHQTFDAKIRNNMFRKAFEHNPDILGTMLVNQYNYFKIMEKLNQISEELTTVRRRQEFFLKPFLWLKQKLLP